MARNALRTHPTYLLSNTFSLDNTDRVYGDFVPVVYVCRHCGEIIYVFERVGQDCYGLPTPSELKERVGAVCPRCKMPLGEPSLSEVFVLGRAPSKKYVLLDQVRRFASEHILSQGSTLLTASISHASTLSLPIPSNESIEGQSEASDAT